MPQLIQQNLLGCEVGHGEQVVRRNQSGQFCMQPRGFAGEKVFVVVMAVDAQPHHSGLGKICQMGMLWQRVFPWSYHAGYGTFGHAAHHDHAAFDEFCGWKSVNQPRHDRPAHHLFGLERHSRHCHKYFAVTFKPHDRCSAYKVLYHRARCGHHGLCGSQCVKFQPSGAYHTLHVRFHGGIFTQLTSEISAQGLFCKVVFCRTETSCRYHGVSFGKCFGYCPEDMLRAVGDHAHAVQLPACGLEHPGYCAGICVCDLTGKQFVAYGYYGILHNK